MNRFLSIGLMILAALLLASCASSKSPYLNSDLASENWRHEIDMNANKWTRGADRWFFTGDPNKEEMADRHASYSAAISTMQVRVPDFTNIKSDGSFQVQIYGDDHNSVYVYGPNAGVREVAVKVRGDTLYLIHAKDAPPCMKDVIIRIGVANLHNLSQMGSGRIEGIQLRSTGLNIKSSGSGNIYLAGNVSLRYVGQSGAGSVSVFGANTPSLDIYTCDCGSVNISGDNVGVRSITHHGSGNVNIINANSRSLKIYADGSGKVGLYGRVNIKEVRAKNYTRVYVYQSSSNTTFVYAYDHARIGMAGYVHNLYVNTYKSSNFAGRYLHADNAYIKAQDSSHVNVTAGNRIFVSAKGSASVYYFGNPDELTQFTSGNGAIIAM